VVAQFGDGVAGDGLVFGLGAADQTLQVGGCADTGDPASSREQRTAACSPCGNRRADRAGRYTNDCQATGTEWHKRVPGIQEIEQARIPLLLNYNKFLEDEWSVNSKVDVTETGVVLARYSCYMVKSKVNHATLGNSRFRRCP
jgi:hypothetical protein